MPKDVAPNVVPLTLSAHCDHPGFWAEAMLDSNTMVANWIGRVPERYFLGSGVTFFTGARHDGIDHQKQTRSVHGTIIEVCDYRGEGDHARVKVRLDGPVEPGSIGQWTLPNFSIHEGIIRATAIDDVAGCAAMVCVMNELLSSNVRRPVRFLFTRAEEAGYLGCVAYCRDQASKSRSQHAQIVGIEMSKTMPDAKIGEGPIVRVGDRKFVFDPLSVRLCLQSAIDLQAEDPAFKFQYKLMPGGTCESSVFQARLGRAAAVCLPLGNYHNVNETTQSIDQEFIDVDDFVGLVRLLVQIAKTDADFDRPFVDFDTECDDLYERQRHLLFQSTGQPELE